MQSDFISGEEVDARLGYWPGTARRMARRGELPCYVLPGDELRFKWPEIEGMIQYRPAVARAGEVTHG
jgi:hypothetical protein